MSLWPSTPRRALCPSASSVLTTLNSIYRFGYFAFYLRIPIDEVPFDNTKETSKFAKVSVREPDYGRATCQRIAHPTGELN